MQIEICEEVTVQTTVDVGIEELITEWGRRADEAEKSPHDWRMSMLAVVDSATRVLARVPDETIRTCDHSARKLVIDRLGAELERWRGIAWESKR